MPFAVGSGGSLLYGYQQAADLGQWTLNLRRDRFGADAWVLTAEIARPHEIWLAKPGPFEVRVRLAKTLWCWRGVSVDRRGDRLVIEGQGRPEERPA